MRKYRILAKLILYPIGIISIITAVRGYFFRESEFDLMPWHGASRYEEPDYKRYSTTKDYFEAEREFLQNAYNEVSTEKGGALNKYTPKSLTSPFDKRGENINLSYELIPDEIKGGVLLLHGMSDSPFITRDLAEIFYEQGYYVLSLRYKYHGTFPGELSKLKWEDLVETAKFGTKMIEQKIKDIPNSKFIIAGYSSGAAVSLYYASHEVKEDASLLKPDKLFWYAPAMGISIMAKMVGPDMILSKIPYFKKFQWLDILPEYDPAKYNSFHKNAGIELDTLIDRAKKYGKRAENLPPIYAYTSLKDATVDETKLFEFLSEVGNEGGQLVIFDANRKFNQFFKKRVSYNDFAKELEGYGIKGDIFVLSNYDKPDDDRVTVFKKNGGESSVIESDNQLLWEQYTFSLGHLSIPISPENRLYGKDSLFGQMSFALKGEKNIANVDPHSLLRLRYNQFFSFLVESMKKIMADGELIE